MCDATFCVVPGMVVHQPACNESQTERIVKVIQQVTIILTAAEAHLHVRRNDGLFDAFFFPEDKITVAKGIRNLLKILDRQTTSVVVSCEPRRDLHDDVAAVNSVFAKLEYNKIPNISYIWLLEKFWDFSLTSTPCMGKFAKELLLYWEDQSTILLHELLHIRYLSENGNLALRDAPNVTEHTSEVARKFRTEPNPPLRPIDSVDNWVWYIILAAALRQQKIQCPENYPLWNYFTPNKPPGVDVQALNGELRKLLQESKTEVSGPIDVVTDTGPVNASVFNNATFFSVDASTSYLTEEISGGG